MTDDAAWPLAWHVSRTGFADLPASAVESAREEPLVKRFLEVFRGDLAQVKPVKD